MGGRRRDVPPWRSVTVQYAAFWSHIGFFKPLWADELLVRSKDAPTLSAVASLGTPRDERWFQTAGDFVPRLLSLVVDASEALTTPGYRMGAVYKHFNILLAQPASNIQRLHVLLPAAAGEEAYELNLASPLLGRIGDGLLDLNVSNCNLILDEHTSVRNVRFLSIQREKSHPRLTTVPQIL